LTPFTINPPKLVYSDDSLSVVWAHTRAYSSGTASKYLHRVQTISSVMILQHISHHRGHLAGTAIHLWCDTDENRHLTDATYDTTDTRCHMTCDVEPATLPRCDEMHSLLLCSHVVKMPCDARPAIPLFSDQNAMRCTVYCLTSMSATYAKFRYLLLTPMS
jgi:hypothetical protein